MKTITYCTNLILQQQEERIYYFRNLKEVIFRQFTLLTKYLFTTEQNASNISAVNLCSVSTIYV